MFDNNGLLIISTKRFAAYLQNHLFFFQIKLIKYRGREQTNKKKKERKIFFVWFFPFWKPFWLFLIFLKKGSHVRLVSSVANNFGQSAGFFTR